MVKHKADRTRSPRWRAGTRRNKRLKTVKSFASDKKRVRN